MSSTVITPGEWTRKLVHIAMGLFALLLRWLSWQQAALCAGAALLFNLFVMPRVGRGIYRDPGRRRDPGIVAYPATVLLLILVFRHDLAVAAAVWGMMAFGDPAASIVGKLVGGPKLPWNREKTWAGFTAYTVVGTLAITALFRFTLKEFPERFWPSNLHLVSLSAALYALPVGALGALLESIKSGFDDNWIPPVPCALALSYWVSVNPPVPPPDPGSLAIPLGVNLLAAAAGGFAGVVSFAGAVAGGAVGTVILAGGGFGAYAVLWAFFLVGTAATRLGYREKQQQGTAQPSGGRRGARHALANCGVPAAIALLMLISTAGVGSLLSLAFASAFAAALADTLGTEIGSLNGRGAFSFSRMASVPRGTPGAVSAIGTLAGFAGATLIGVVAAALRVVEWNVVWIVVLSGLFGSLAESLLLDTAVRRGISVDHEFANAFNTFVGAVVALEIALSVGAGHLYIPIESVRPF